MSGEVPLAQKVAGRRLQQFRAAIAPQPRDLLKTLDLFPRNHQIRQPQSRKQHLAEGPGVQHAVMHILALQCRQRPPSITKLAVIVIFQYPTRLHLRPIEQGLPPIRAQRHAQWALMSRGDHCQPRLQIQADTVFHPQTVGIHRHRHQLHAAIEQHLPRMHITRVLKPATLARHLQAFADQFEHGVVTGADKHLIRRALHASIQPQVRGNGRAQRRIASRVAEAQTGDIGLPGTLGDQSAPEFSRERIQRRKSHLQGPRLILFRRRHRFC